MAIARIATQSASGSAGNTVTVAWPAAPTAGNLLVVTYFDSQGTSIQAGLTGYISAALDTGANIKGVQILYKVATASEPSITVNDTGNTVGLALNEYNGFTGTPTLDVTAATSSATASLVSGTGTTATTTVAAELAFAAAYIGPATTFSSWSNTFVNLAQIGAAYTAEKILTATGTQTTAITATGTASTTGGCIATFKGVVATITAHNLTLLGVGK